MTIETSRFMHTYIESATEFQILRESKIERYQIAETRRQNFILNYK